MFRPIAQYSLLFIERVLERSTDSHAQGRSNPKLICDLGLIDSLHILQVLVVEDEQAVFLQLLVIVA